MAGVWERLGQAGAGFTGPQRLAIARVTRAALADPDSIDGFADASGSLAPTCRHRHQDCPTAAMYMDGPSMADLEWSRGTLDRRQTELVAARLSSLRECSIERPPIPACSVRAAWAAVPIRQVLNLDRYQSARTALVTSEGESVATRPFASTRRTLGWRPDHGRTSVETL